MRRALAIAAAIAAVSPITAAHATPPLFTGTTCGLLAVSDPTKVDTYVGVVDGSVAAVDLVHLDGNLTHVSITCALRVNGVMSTIYKWPASGAAAAVLATTVQFNAASSDNIELCTTVVAADAQGSSTQLGPFCRNAPHTGLVLVDTLLVGGEVIAPR